MEAIVVERAPLGSYLVYLRYDSTHYLRMVDGERVVEEVAERAEPPYFTELSADELTAIVRAANKVLPFGDDAREALADARTVRDRLLSLVESVWEES